MLKNTYGPSLAISEEIDAQKYRQTGEDFYSKVVRIADSLKDSSEHFEDFKDVLRNMRFIPAGRVQNAMGAARQTTALIALCLVRLMTAWKAYETCH